ncbi:hypothetical protein [Actinoplanes sp. NPDC051494]|uniref:hypothetical protein n=1 Tax=Actinoplanes sp. NPDC051494 TaxID=3363907 RepID=UPI0037B6DC91
MVSDTGHHTGHQTRDLRDLRQPHPNEPAQPRRTLETSDTVNRRWGAAFIAAGLALILGTTIVTGALPEVMTVNVGPAGLTVMSACMTTGSSLVVVGGLEFFSRYIRAYLRRLEANQRKILDGQAKIQARLDDHADQAGLTAAAVNRMERIVEKVPTYGETIVKGIELGKQSGGAFPG